MSEERLVSSLDESESVKKSEMNFDDARIEKIKKDFNKLWTRLSKQKIKEIRKSLYRIENKKLEEIEKNLLKLEKNPSKLKKYYDYDDIEYGGKRDVRNLFNLSTDEDYYKPMRTNSSFNVNYIEDESEGDMKKTLSIKEYLDMIRPYLRDLINDRKTQGEWKVLSGNEVINYKIQGEWKIRLIMIINFRSSKDSDETRTMRTTGSTIKIMMGVEADEVIEEFSESFLQKHQKELEEKMRGSRFFLIVLIYCIIIFID